MSDEDPPPLKSTSGTPDQLVRALRALGRDDLDAARLARVAERLGDAFAASGSPATSWLRNVAGTKLGLTGFALGLGALAWLGYTLATQRTLPAKAPAAAPAALGGTAAAPHEPALQEPAPSRAAVQLQHAVTAAPEREPLRSAPRAGSVRASRERERVVAAAPASATAPAADRAPASSAISPSAARGGDDKAAASAAEPEPTRAQPEPPAAEQPAAQPKPQPPAQRSEAALLLEARKASTREPQAALRLLDEHARRFPSGLLVPERELLAIEVLRRVGRVAEAERRLRRFEARYPESIHLRRLEHGAGRGAQD